MKILIINNSLESDPKIINIINEYFIFLQSFCETIPKYEILLASEELKKEVKEMNDKFDYLPRVFSDYFLNNASIELQGELANCFKEEDLSQSKTIILSEDLKIKFPWGEANNHLAFIKHITKSNIWHEFSHTFGLDDHYDINNKYKVKSFCNLETCFMRYGNSALTVCDNGKKELEIQVNRIINIV